MHLLTLSSPPPAAMPPPPHRFPKYQPTVLIKMRLLSPLLPFLAMLSSLVTRASTAGPFSTIPVYTCGAGSFVTPLCVGAKCKPFINGDTKLWAYDSAHSDEFDVAGPVSGAKKWSQELGDWTGTKHHFIFSTYFCCCWFCIKSGADSVKRFLPTSKPILPLFRYV